MKKILFIDDDDEVLDIVEQVLTYEHYTIKCHNRGTGFISIVEEFSPDLILLDFKLADGNGGEICLALKKDPKYSLIPVVIVTAYSKPGLDFSSFGCNAVINKPFDLDNLLDVTRKWTDPFFMKTPLPD